MKQNGSHKRSNASDPVSTNRLIDTDAMRDNYSNYVLKFLEGFKSEYQ